MAWSRTRVSPEPCSAWPTSATAGASPQTFRAAGFGKHQRLAVLYRTDPHGGARAFAFTSRIQGWQVRAFADFEAAVLWLSEGTESHEGESPVRITKRKAKQKTYRWN